MRALPLFLIASTLAAIGCSKAPDASGPAPSSAANPAAEAAPPKSSAAPTVRADERPFEQYQAPGSDAVAWVAQYYAASGSPINAGAVAARLDPQFQATTDAFARQDATAAMQKRLEAAVSAAKANPFVRLPPMVAHMPDYDVAKGRYDLQAFIGPSMGLDVAHGNAQVGFAPNPGLSGYAPESEAAARTLERAIASNPLGRQVQVTVYGKVVAAQARGGTPDVTIIPTRVVVLNYFVDGHTEPLFVATTAP
jgi:hypothetical protein